MDIQLHVLGKPDGHGPVQVPKSQSMGHLSTVKVNKGQLLPFDLFIKLYFMVSTVFTSQLKLLM